ncbi:ABC transporter ATP-binding protein [Olivibacter sitiensis]|uniref:ABC transporter ATP-binding protein n=1 Tax=Olivibacter sitiensis TaxID=376470 RepID=UPI000420A546|nr:ABC transporter transmembrane domain-containing protein [Olivibacter sitiensis]
MARARLNSGDCSQDDFPKAKINKKSIKNIGKLLTYLRPYRLKFFFGFLFLVLSSLSLLALPALMGSMVDAAQGEQTLAVIPSDMKTIGVVTFCILAFQSFISFFRIRLFVEVAERTLADIRKDTYFNLITLPMDFFANRRVGELNSRLSSDLSQIQDTMTTTFAEMIRQGILLIGGICFLFIVSIKLTMLNLAILPVVVVVAAFFGRFIRNLSRKAQDKLAESNTIVQETLQGISNVKAFVNEAYEAKRYANSLQSVVNLALKGASYRGLFASFILFCIFGAVVAVIWYGASLIATGELTVGSLTTYIISSLFVAGSMGSFPELYATVQKTVGATERVVEILEEKREDVSIVAEDNQVKEHIAGQLRFEHVGFSYPSRKEVPVLQDISFDLDAGEKVAIVGPSGTGKSTLASLILRFYDPTAGQIYFDERPALSFKLTDIRNQVAIVPQDVLLFGGSIKENIAYGKLGASDEEIIEAASKANAHHFIEAFPEGYDTMVGERGVKLSGGQRQRIAIARALLKDPAILILDEATSSLDSESERLVQQALESLMKGRTSIIIAHRLSTIREADKIIVIDAGRVVECGTHNELLLNENGLYRYLCGLQQEQKVV